MDAAKKGITTPQLKAVSEKENIDVEELKQLVAAGKVVIPANKNHKSLHPEGVGSGLRTKINVNLGVSKDCYNIDYEKQKVRIALAMEAHSIMDLSCYGKTRQFRQWLINESTALVGTVPVYDAVGLYDKELDDITPDEFLDVVRTHAEDGVDFVTIHAGVNREAASVLKKNQRVTSVVSRGGALLFSWMQANNAENPFYEHFDKLLDICEEYDVTLSLGDGCRPGCIEDSTDSSQVYELMVLGELTEKAWERNVQVIIEGPGHMALNEIEANVLLEKKLCHGAPFYVLGPLVTDVAPGYDHITGAIGGAIAAMHGADFLCYVTPAEHLRLPDVNDVVEGIVASKIAAHAADIARGIPGARAWDREMSRARANFDWEKMFNLAMDPVKARRYREESTPEDKDVCTMCGNMCALRNMKRAMEAGLKKEA